MSGPPDYKLDENLPIFEKINKGSTDGLKTGDAGEKGTGVFSTRRFSKDEFITEYKVVLIPGKEGKRLEKDLYSKYPEKYGCYQAYFTYKNEEKLQNLQFVSLNK